MLGLVRGEGISVFFRTEAGDFNSIGGRFEAHFGWMRELIDLGKPCPAGEHILTLQILAVLTDLSSQLCLRRQRRRQRR